MLQIFLKYYIFIKKERNLHKTVARIRKKWYNDT